MTARVSERLKRLVHDRAHGLCEYCRISRQYSMMPFCVEHIIPRALKGSNSLENLALACQGCNGHKHAKIEGPDPITQKRIRFFHPRHDLWTDHFVWSHDYLTVLGTTPTGRATVQALHLNRQGLLNLRALLHGAGLHPPREPDQPPQK